MERMHSKIVHFSIDKHLVDAAGELEGEALSLLANTIEIHDLNVVVAVLSHRGSEPARLRVSSQLLSQLVKTFHEFPRVQLLWSMQGSPPLHWREELVPKSVVALEHSADRLMHHDGHFVECGSGKSEHLLMLVRYLLDAGYPSEDTFLVVLDDDYAVYDAVNVLGLFAPWVLGRIGTDWPVVGYTKGGGARVVPPLSLLTEIRDGKVNQLTFGQLCKTVAAQCGGDISPQLERQIITPEYLNALPPEETTHVRLGLRDLCRSGGRNSVALSTYLASVRDNPLATSLRQFSFLLHGDQGATLSNWAALELGTGFSLELSFLMGALTRSHTTQTVCNVITLPHSHFPREAAASFELGVEMFSVLASLLASREGAVSESALTRQSTSFFALGDFFITREIGGRLSTLNFIKLPPATCLVTALVHHA